MQVLWGGQWKDGSGGGSGEDMELLFSYLSRWGFITENMLSYRKCCVQFNYMKVMQLDFTKSA